MIKRILARLQLLKRFNFNETKIVNGKKVIIPVIKGIAAGETEPWMLEIIKKLAPRFNTGFVDVGVNNGQTLIKAWTVFDKIQYVGFDPNPHCNYYVKELIAANKMEHVTMVPVGIGNKNELLKLHHYYDDDTDTTASMIEGFRPEQQVHHYQYVPVCEYTSVKELLPVQENAILKIDVEGAEWEVLEGLKTWIALYHPVILVEILPPYKQDNYFRIGRQQKIETLLKELNYCIYRICKDGDIHLQQLPGFDIHDDIEKSDYVLIHASHREYLPELINVENL